MDGSQTGYNPAAGTSVIKADHRQEKGRREMRTTTTSRRSTRPWMACLAALTALVTAGCGTNAHARASGSASRPDQTPANSPESRPAGTPTIAVAAPCAVAQLTPVLRFVGGAAGTITYTVDMKNSGPACSLQGFPVIDAIADDGTTANPASSQPASTSPPTVTIAAGGDGHFNFHYLDNPQHGASSCPTVNELKIHLPGLASPLDLRQHVGLVCSAVFVGPIQTGP